MKRQTGSGINEQLEVTGSGGGGGGDATAANQALIIAALDSLIAQNVQTATAPITAAVTATSSIAVATNASRKKATVTNWGANDVCLAYGTPAIFGSGDYLVAGGGSATAYTTQSIRAICDTAKTSNLAAQEWE